MNQIRKVASSDGKQEEESLPGMHKTGYGYATEERNPENRIYPSNSVGNTFWSNDSYNSPKKKPYDSNVSSKMFKKNKRKAITTAKKKMGSFNMGPTSEKSVSPNLKLKKKKEKSIPLSQPYSTKMNPDRVAAHNSFTLENINKNGPNPKNLIDDFSQKYAYSEKVDKSMENFGSAVDRSPLKKQNEDDRSKDLNRKYNNESSPSESESNKTSSNSVNENVAIIHVIDEAKRRQQDFKCSISKLLKHMKYFEKSINGCEDKIGLDISVHCDLETFEWLIKYIHLDPQFLNMEWVTQQEAESGSVESTTGSTPRTKGTNVLPMFDAISLYENSILKPVSTLCLNLSNIITLLVAAEYLKMDTLKEDWVQFIGKYFEEICKLKINMNFLKPQTLERLSQFVDIEILDVMRERKDKFISKLFDKKLELLLTDEDDQLQRCIFCDSLYSSNTNLICTKNPDYFIDLHGRLMCSHIADCDFDVSKFVRYVKERYRVSWRELYWKIWAFNYTERWIDCNEEFSLPHYTFWTKNKGTPMGCLEQSGISSILNPKETPREWYHNVQDEDKNKDCQTMLKRKHIIWESKIISHNSNLYKDAASDEDTSKPLHKRINHFEGMTEEEKAFFASTTSGELLSCNFRLSLHKALQEYLMDQRKKEGRDQSVRSDFEIESDEDLSDREGVCHADFFDINIDVDSVYKELEFIKKRLEDRKKAQIKHANKINKQLTREQENKKKEIKEREKSDGLQGDVVEDTPSGTNNSKEEDKEPDSANATDTDSKEQDDSKQTEQPQPKKSVVILSQNEIKEKLENHIDDIDSKMENRLKLSKRMILRDIDCKIMDSLTKALKMKRLNECSSSGIRRKAKNTSNKKLPPLNSNHSMNMTSQKSWTKGQKLKSRANPKSSIFQSSSPYLKPGSASGKRPSSVNSKKQP